MSPAAIFTAHSGGVPAYAARQWLKQYAWAYAGNAGEPRRVWEFEPASPRPTSGALRSEDHNPLSGSYVIGAFWIDRAKSLLRDLREHKTDYRPSRRNRDLAAKAFGILREEGVPGELARAIANRVVERSDFEDPMTWRGLGRVLQEEFAAVRPAVRVPDYAICAALSKLPTDEIQALFTWLEREDRWVAGTIFAAAVTAADPMSAARRYMDNYRVAFRAALKLDPARAATAAHMAFTKPDVLKAVKEFFGAGSDRSK